MDEVKSIVYEWTIKNFSCWNNELHGNVISNTTPGLSLQLYPRGPSGSDERLVVSLCCSEPWSFLGHDLSFIGPDGYLLSKQQVRSKEKMVVLQLPPGPEFKDVVTKIKKNEAEDRLTLRWRIKNTIKREEYSCTTINAFDFIYKISSKILCDLCLTPTTISCLYYPLDDEKRATMFLRFSENESDRSKIVLTLTSREKVTTHHKILVFTRMSVLNDDIVVRNEENEHLFLVTILGISAIH